MEFELAGYFPKDTSIPSGWNGPAHVGEICSVSGCVNKNPPHWMDRWVHNGLGLFHTVADAEAAVPQGSSNFRIYAYRLLSRSFGELAQEPLPERFDAEPVPEDFVSLGYDVASRSVTPFFECSPLSCNGLASEVAVNRYCLIGTLDEAVAFAERCRKEQPEPGTYYVVEVLRDSRIRG